MSATTPRSGIKLLSFLFSSFEGRVSRSQFWWAGSILFTAQFVLTVALARTLGLGWRDFAFGDRRALWVILVVVAFFFWPSLALSVKRLHDRDLPGWWAGLLHTLLFIFYVDQAATRAILRDKSAVLLSMVPVAMLFLVGAWLTIELALLAGTHGENRFGPAPADSPTAPSPLDRPRELEPSPLQPSPAGPRVGP